MTNIKTNNSYSINNSTMDETFECDTFIEPYFNDEMFDSEEITFSVQDNNYYSKTACNISKNENCYIKFDVNISRYEKRKNSYLKNNY